MINMETAVFKSTNIQVYSYLSINIYGMKYTKLIHELYLKGDLQF